MKIGEIATKYWLEFLFGLIASGMTAGFLYVWRKFRRSQKEQNNIKNGIKALLRDRIIQAYNHYTEKGYCPIYGLENVHDMHKEYKALGGNGTVDRLVAELEQMPRNRPGEAGGDGQRREPPQ